MNPNIISIVECTIFVYDGPSKHKSCSSFTNKFDIRDILDLVDKTSIDFIFNKLCDKFTESDVIGTPLICDFLSSRVKSARK